MAGQVIRITQVIECPPGTKHCHRCGLVKPLIEFNKNKHIHGGFAADCRLCHNRVAKEEYQRLRLEALTAYSKTIGPSCTCCGESIIEFLAIDHIDGNGAEHRRLIKTGGMTFYRWLRKNKFPSGYQTLCHNCNFAKWVCETCPHGRAL